MAPPPHSEHFRDLAMFSLVIDCEGRRAD